MSLMSEEEKTNPREMGEEKTKGSVGCKVYFSYFSACRNWFLVFLVIFSFVLTQVVSSLGDYWCSKW